MGLLDDILHTKSKDNAVMSEEEEVEQEIASVLKYSGYEQDSEEWNSAMFRWKRRRGTKPRMYRKFVELD